jgi:hypothetical protein
MRARADRPPRRATSARRRSPSSASRAGGAGAITSSGSWPSMATSIRRMSRRST